MRWNGTQIRELLQKLDIYVLALMVEIAIIQKTLDALVSMEVFQKVTVNVVEGATQVSNRIKEDVSQPGIAKSVFGKNKSIL